MKIIGPAHGHTETFSALGEAEHIEDYVVSLQQDFHLHPEVSLQEVRTMAVVTSELERMNIPYETVPNGGIIGIIEGEQEGKSLILRADLDALPMKEEKMNLKQAKKVVSENDEAAHTCGHDGHTAMLLGAADILSRHRDKVKGKVILAFEQGEENGAGIYAILNRLVEIGADGIWGIHLKSDIPTGRISVDPGPRMAAAFGFNVRLSGKSGHGARPDLSISPLDCFTDFYQNLKAMRLNTLNPFQALTVSVGAVNAGFSPNVIPEELQFSGTGRYLHQEQGEEAVKEFKRLLKAVCEVHRCSFEYTIEPYAMDLLVYNQEECAAVALEAMKKSVGEDVVINYPAWMASEPFAFYQRYFPGVFAFLGIQNDEKGTGAEHHNAFFELDENALKVGVAATVQYAIDFLSHKEAIRFSPEQQGVREYFEKIGFPVPEEAG